MVCTGAVHIARPALRLQGGMFSFWDGVFNSGDGDGAQAQQDGHVYQQSQGGQAPSQTQDGEQQQAGGLPSNSEASQLRPLWDQGTSADGRGAADGAGARSAAAGTAGPGQGQSQGQSQSEAQRGQRQTNNEKDRSSSYEDPEERAERRAQERREDLTKELQAAQELVTVGEAVEYCKLLVETQLERAEMARAGMNAPIYGDAQARKAITTLLPDNEIRNLFLRTTQQKKAWPRLRSLFGVPPYNFLHPEDAGLVRASGIATGRTHMAYEQAGQTANYSQFGSGHYVDSFEREYRVVPRAPPRGADSLPYDLENIEPATFIFMNVRVPKRSREQKQQLLKDQAKRRAVLFPYVGEELTVQYSSALRMVWRSDKTMSQDRARVIVKSMTPRSATASTAAVVAVRV